MKLKGLPRIVYLNAKQDSTQNQLMIEHFDHYGIKDYIRHEKKYTTKVRDSSTIKWDQILADDYSDDGIGKFVTGSFDHSFLLEDELALTLDNYDAIINWYDNTDDEVCIVMDDIVRLHMSNHWMFDWEYAYQRLPYNWDCIQLFVSSASQKIPMNLHPWQREHRSTRCYMISRLFAKKIKRFHYPDGKFRLHYRCRDKSIPANDYGNIETTLFNLGNTYLLPLFNLDENFLHYDDDYDVRLCRDKLSSDSIDYWWTQVAGNYSLEEQFSYGRDNEYEMEVTFDMRADHVHKTRERILLWI
tara:strand:+ start:1647 stop:2549 length:903 start_codon:yes stop_codon:yes gene_type:complete